MDGTYIHEEEVSLNGLKAIDKLFNVLTLTIENENVPNVIGIHKTETKEHKVHCKGSIDRVKYKTMGSSPG